MAGKIGESNQNNGEPELTVATRVLLDFLESVCSDPALPGIGERLKTALVEKQDLSEVSIRQALFGDAV